MRRSLLDDRILASLGIGPQIHFVRARCRCFAAASFGSFAIAWLIGFFAFFLPAGFGAREGVFTFNLSLFLSGGIAGIVAIVSRTLNVLIEIIAFVFGLTMMSSEELEEE